MILNGSGPLRAASVKSRSNVLSRGAGRFEMKCDRMECVSCAMFYW
jgi:hypothetical protein